MAASLLRHSPFRSLFGCQFLGALNDNLFKNAFLIAISYGHMRLAEFEPAFVVALGSGVFILPFFLFSPIAGQLSDKLPKATLVRSVKAAEVVLMVLAALAFYLHSPWGLLALLFLMGAQSSLFGPAKYSILPELVGSKDLSGANALVETGTFVAILLGTIAGGLLAALGHEQVWILCATLVVIALLGALTSRGIPISQGQDPDLRISVNPLPSLRQSYRACTQVRSVALSVLGISWFWFFGSALLTIFPTFAKQTLHGNEHVVTLLLALFCVGTSIGAIVSERLGGRQLELGLVPLGALGLSACALDMVFSTPSLPADAPLIDLATFVQDPQHWRLLADVTLLAVFGGLYTVPLYTLLQDRSDPSQRSRVIAGNNILNAVFMVAAALMLMGLGALDLEPIALFGVLAALNALVAIYIFSVVPEFFLRFVAWCLANFGYRMRTELADRIPEQGPALLIANHASFVDWLFVASATQRPVRFVMYHTFFDIPVLGWLFRMGQVIPIAPAKENPDTLRRAFEQIDQTLKDGELVCIFPEGELTKDGLVGAFRPGIQKILQAQPVPVVPMALEDLWNSLFSRNRERPPLWRRLRTRKVKLVVGEVIPAQAAIETSLDTFRTRVCELSAHVNPRPEAVPSKATQTHAN